MAHLFWPDKEQLVAKGYASVSHVPVIFASNWRYHAEASRYLRERALAEWSPSPNSSYRVVRKKYLTEKSLGTIANALINFIEWCEHRVKDWRKLTYTEDLIQGYQAEMLKGKWAIKGHPLKGSTVNQRISQACYFLRWAGDRGLRSPFNVVASSLLVRANSRMGANGHRLLQVQTRAGAVRESPASLRIPTDQEVGKWLTSVRIERGATKALMCELVLSTAIRREELIQWRVDTLPLDRSDWEIIGDQVQVLIKYGTKGPKYPGPDGEEGPPRKIAMPISVAERLHAYRELRRPKARAQYVRNAKTQEERRKRQREKLKELFLSDATGLPYTPQVIYEAWTAVKALPYKGWSPHAGRHYWACKTLLKALECRTKTMALAHDLLPSGWISDSATDTLNLVIRPQLGHLSPETSRLYLVWVERTFILCSLHCAYEQSLEAMLHSSQESNA